MKYLNTIFISLLLSPTLVAQSTDDNYWAYQPVQKVSVPPVEDSSTRNPIDAFILAGLREKGITDKKKVLHSTRHTFITKLKQLDIQDHLISELVGHTVESITVGRYGKKLDVKALSKAIEMLGFQIYL